MMAMGITSALKLQEGSIRELAMLPQNVLMQMAQTGRIAPTLLPVVLNEKAEMAKQAANAQVLAKSAQGKPPSIIEQDMATNAQAEQAEEETPDTGLAALPVSDKVFSAAGGGIVAFDDGGEVKRYANEGMVRTDMPSVPTSLNPTLRNKKADPKVLRAYYIANGLPIPEELKTDAEKGIFPESQPASTMGELLQKPFEGFTRPMGQINEPSAIEKFFMRRKQEAMGGAPSVESPRGIAAISGAGVAGGDVEAQPGGFYGGQMPSTTPAVPPVARKTKGPSAADEGVAPQRTTTQSTDTSGIKGIGRGSFADAYSQAEGILKGKLAPIDAEDPMKDIKEELKKASETRKAELKESAWLRLAEFGLGMAGGESPYALVNAGKAGVQAIKGYGEDLKEKKKLDREDRKTLADIKKMEQAERRGDVIKTADLGFKIFNEMGEDARARLQAETSERTAKMQLNKPSVYSEVSADLRSPDPAKRKAAEAYLGTSKLGTMTYEDAVKLAIQGNPTLGMPGREQQLQAAVQNLLAGQGGSRLPTGVKFLGTRPQ